jgi:hypothetical protein
LFDEEVEGRVGVQEDVVAFAVLPQLCCWEMEMQQGMSCYLQSPPPYFQQMNFHFLLLQLLPPVLPPPSHHHYLHRYLHHHHYYFPLLIADSCQALIADVAAVAAGLDQEDSEN